MSDTVGMAALLARLEALTTRLDEQSSRIRSLETENARLTATLAPPEQATVRPSGLVTSRRGMLLSLLSAGTAVTALGVASKPTSVAASHEGPVLLGHTNMTNGTTQISRYANVGYGLVVYAPVTGSYAVYGQGDHTGVYGLGRSYGVFATSASIGVYGNGDGTAGVWGNTTGMYSDGVRGDSPWNGVAGRGSGANGYGGYFSSSHSAGIYSSTARSDKNYAGFFNGNVYIQGSYTATGAKSASVKKRNGTHVRMYCQEAPEPWFEDFGTAELKNGRAEVALDAEFDEVVKGDDYRVFLTAIGDTGFLYVSRKHPHRFEVRSERGASANGTFDYRIVARRLDDVGKRLEKVDVPTESPERRRQREELERPPEPKKPEGIR